MEIIHIKEHDEIKDDGIKNIIRKIKNDENINTSIALLKSFNSNNKDIRAGYKIGCCWISKEKALYVSPKEHKKDEGDIGKKADFQRMFEECMEDKDIANNIGESYSVFFDEEKIKIDSKIEYDMLTIVLIYHFLTIVENIAKRGLKRGYIHKRENLTGKIKGKISIIETIRKNHFKKRMDRTVCDFQDFTLDCLENRILKFALYKTKSYIEKYRKIKKFERIEELLAYNINAFAHISLVEIKSNDFQKVKHSPFYKDYKIALNLAYMIIKRFGFTLYEEKEKQEYYIYPFYIDMSKLFEFYVELKLKKGGVKNIKSQVNIKKCGNIGELIPDLLLCDDKMIVDSKYKYWFEKGIDSNEFRSDFSQIALYGRRKQIRELLKLSDDEIPHLAFIYPILNDNKKNGIDKITVNDIKESKEDCFYKFYKKGIEIPCYS